MGQVEVGEARPTGALRSPAGGQGRLVPSPSLGDDTDRRADEGWQPACCGASNLRVKVAPGGVRTGSRVERCPCGMVSVHFALRMENGERDKVKTVAVATGQTTKFASQFTRKGEKRPLQN